MEINTIQDVWDAISGEKAINSKVEGDLTLEEYALKDGTYLQVALDASIGNDPVEWVVLEEETDWWVVG